MKEIGIDAGGTLIKIAYEEQGKLHVKSYPQNKLKEVVQWIQIVSPTATLKSTGGKRESIANLVQNRYELVDEFQAIINGTSYLLEEEKIKIGNEYILVSIGTGTSVFHVHTDGFDRLLGSGIGGGTFLGLGKLLSGKTRFEELTDLASRGDREKSDLLVKDIYATGDAPLLGNLTAANFGKAGFQKALPEDHMSALNQLIGEVIISLASLAARSKQVKPIVFVGSTLSGNAPLKSVLSSFQDWMDYTPVFLEKGAYAGAIGTIM